MISSPAAQKQKYDQQHSVEEGMLPKYLWPWPPSAPCGTLKNIEVRSASLSRVAKPPKCTKIFILQIKKGKNQDATAIGFGGNPFLLDTSLRYTSESCRRFSFKLSISVHTSSFLNNSQQATSNKQQAYSCWHRSSICWWCSYLMRFDRVDRWSSF
jgi:hypothetical protein